MKKIISEDIIKNIDEIVWYIPFRKLRDSIRKLLINYINNSNYIYNELEIRRRENELTTYNEDNYYKKRVFKENVCWVEIGISSFCNRKCWFCPNSIIDRNSCNIELNENLFLKLLSELREIKEGMSGSLLIGRKKLLCWRGDTRK